MAAVLAAGSAALDAAPADGKKVDQASAILDRSVANLGDTARIQHVLAKARRGENIVVGAIGGSITDGGHVRPGARYGKRVTTWFQKTFPKAAAKYVNAGVGATGSDFGALRAQRDLLAHKPDLVIVEFAVNEPNELASAESMEGLVRQFLKHPNHPAVILLFTMHRNGTNAQEWHGKVGMHYDLPMVSYRDALWPEIEAGRMRWKFVTVDSVHPNTKGHEYMVRFVTHVLEKVLQDLPAKKALPDIKPLPKPLFSDLFEHVALLEAAARIERLTGFRPCSAFRPHGGWRSGQMYLGLALIDYTLIGWGWFLWDWDWFRTPDPDRLIRRFVDRVSAGDIVVMHDGHHEDPRAERRYAIDATAGLVPRLREAGFTFGAIC